eukprot:Skav216914  [mRNA]  locus=scaffold3288:223662:224468:- [translate_table: standard]
MLTDKTEHWRYLLALKRERAKLVSIVAQEDDLQQQPSHSFLAWTQQYDPQGQQWMPSHCPGELFQLSMYGSEFASAFHTWAHTLRWHLDEDPQCKWQRRAKVPVGVSWMELTVNFILQCQQYPPVARGTGQHGDFQVQTFEFASSPAGLGLAQLATSIQSIARFFASVGHPVLPMHLLTNVKSMRFFGAGGYLRGFKLRPWMPLQSITMEVLSQYVPRIENRMGYPDLPTFPSQPAHVRLTIPVDVETATASERHQRYASYRRHIRVS